MRRMTVDLLQILQRMSYLYELPDWPLFYWDNDLVVSQLSAVRNLQGRLTGRYESINRDIRANALVDAFTLDVVKSAEIEGEHFKTEIVRSSIASKLSLDLEKPSLIDKNAEGMIEMLLDATTNSNLPLTQERLFQWHTTLFSGSRSNLVIGAWRTDQKGKMQVVSGAIGRERVHYVAPKAEELERQMTQFLKWLNADSPLDLVLKSAVAHFWFVTIHPFQDGNGRIARVISDWLLSKADQPNERYYSMSAQICTEKKGYYQILEKSQIGTLDITDWMVWYLNCLKNALLASVESLNQALSKAKFWNTYAHLKFNDRQISVLSRLLDGFDGALTSEKWMKRAKCSKDSAIRDLNDLIQKGVLSKSLASGKNTSYLLVNLD